MLFSFGLHNSNPCEWNKFCDAYLVYVIEAAAIIRLEK